MSHSCVVVDLEDHFRPDLAEMRALFNAYVSFVESHGGPVTVIPQRSRIALQSRVRFGSVIVRRRWIDVALWLKRPADHPLLRKVDDVGTAGWYHWFRITDASQLDEEFGSLAAESYRV